MDPRSSLQHIFTATVVALFRKQLFSIFGELVSAARGCSSLSLLPQYSRNSIFSILPGNQLSSVYNRELHTNTAILSWFVGLNPEAYLSFFKDIILARPGFGGGWSTSYTVTSSIDSSEVALQKHKKHRLARHSMLSESFAGMGLTFQPLLQQTSMSGIYHPPMLNSVCSQQVASLCYKLFLLCL